MDYGLQLSASGLLTSLYRMDVQANNLANVNTVGFKPDFAVARQRQDARQEHHLGNVPSNALLERLGGGVLRGPNRTSFKQGAVIDSPGGTFDLAIQGEGFFALGGAKGDRVNLTRSGRFTLDSEGTLVSADNGLPALSTTGDKIKITDRDEVTIDGDGAIKQRGTIIANLQIVDTPDKSVLTKAGQSMFTAARTAVVPASTATMEVKQRALEQSAVDPVQAMMAITAAQRDVEANATMIQHADHIMDRAINGLGRSA